MGGKGQQVGGGWRQPKSSHQLISNSVPYFKLGHHNEISRCLTHMVLTINSSLSSAGKVDNWVLGRADL